MKVVNVFAQLFAIFSFLTLGSLLVIVGLHLLSLDDAILRVRELYESPWKSLKTGVLGCFFISVGLIFSRMLLKTGRQAEAIIYQSEIGPIVVSVQTIEDVTKKVIKRFSLIKSVRIKTLVSGKNVQLKLRLVLWSSDQMSQLLHDVQVSVRDRVQKLLGVNNKVEVNCDVHKIEDPEPLEQKV